MSKSLSANVLKQIENRNVKAVYQFKINNTDYSDYLLSWNLSMDKSFGSASATFVLANQTGQFGEIGANKIFVGDIVEFFCGYEGDTELYKMFYGQVDQRPIQKNSEQKIITLNCLDYISVLQYLDIDEKFEAPKIKIENDTLDPVYLSSDPTSDLYDLAQLFNFSNDAIATSPPPILTIRNKDNYTEDPQYDGFNIYYQTGQVKLGYSLNARYNHDVVAKSYYIYTKGLYVEDIIQSILTLPDAYGKYLFKETSVQNVIDNHLTETFYNMEGDDQEDYLTPNTTASEITIYTYVESDHNIESSYYDNSLTVTSTEGLPDTGTASVNGDIFTWTSKDDTHLYGISGLNTHLLYINEDGETIKPILKYETTYDIGQVWYLKYSNLITDLVSTDFQLPSGNSISYIDKRFGRIILSSAINITSIVKCLVDYSFITLQATGIELNEISFKSRDIENRFEALKKLYDYVAPNYIIRTIGDDKIWSEYLSQRSLADYNLDLITDIQYMEDEDIYTRVLFYAKNKEPHNIVMDSGVEFLTSGEEYLAYADQTELTYEKTEGDFYIYKCAITNAGKIVLEQNTIDGTVRIEPEIFINNVKVDSHPYQMPSQPITKEMTTRTETITITKKHGKSTRTETYVNTYYYYQIKFPHTSLMPTQAITLYNANAVTVMTIQPNDPYMSYDKGVYYVPGSSRNSLVESISTGTYWVQYNTGSLTIDYDNVRFKIRNSIIKDTAQDLVKANFQYLTAFTSVIGIDNVIDGRWDTQTQTEFYAEPPTGYNYAILDLGSIKDIQALDLVAGFFKPDNIRKFDIDMRLTIQYSLDNINYYPISDKTSDFTLTGGQHISFEEEDLGQGFQTRYLKLIIENLNKIEYGDGVWVVALTELVLYSDIVIKGESKLIPYTLTTEELFFPTNQPILHYKLNDNTTSTVVLDSISTNNGVSSSNTNTLSQSGKIDKCFYFDGNDKIATTHFTALDNLSDNFSFSFWLKDNLQTSANHGVIVKRGSGSFYSITLEKKDASSNYLKIRINDGTNNIQPRYLLPNLGEWKHIVITIDGRSTTSLKVYCNNTELITAETKSMASFGSLANTNNLSIGWENVNNVYADAYLDDIRIYNCTLSVDEINYLYNEGVGRETDLDVILVETTKSFDEADTIYLEDSTFTYTSKTDTSFLGVSGITGSFSNASRVSKTLEDGINIYDKLNLLDRQSDRVYKEIKVEDEYLYTQDQIDRLAKAYLYEFIKNHQKIQVSILYTPYLRVGQTVRLTDSDYNGIDQNYFIESISHSNNGIYNLVLGRYEE